MQNEHLSMKRMNIVTEYICDICNDRRFSTFEEAEDHERICAGPYLSRMGVMGKNKNDNGNSGKQSDFYPKTKKMRRDEGLNNDDNFYFLPLMTIIAAAATAGTTTKMTVCPMPPPTEKDGGGMGTASESQGLNKGGDDTITCILLPSPIAILGMNHDFNNAKSMDSLVGVDHEEDHDRDNISSAFEIGGFKSSPVDRHIDESSPPEQPQFCMLPNEKTKLSVKETRCTVRYPAGCPVWFNLQYSNQCLKHAMANKGVVKSFSFDSGAKTMMYEIEQHHSVGRTNNPNSTPVHEKDIAYAIHCPVLVRQKWDTGNSEIEGEIIYIKLSHNEHGSAILYTVLYTTSKGGGVIVEEDIVTERIKYKFSLHTLQSQLRIIVASPRNSRGIGIRSNIHDEAIQNKLCQAKMITMERTG